MPPSWLLPALRAVLPHAKAIYDTALPVFTKRKAETGPDALQLLQQQVSELQSATGQNTANVKALAGQLQSTVAALQEAATLADNRLRRVTLVAAFAAAFALAALALALVAIVR